MSDGGEQLKGIPKDVALAAAKLFDERYGTSRKIEIALDPEGKSVVNYQERGEETMEEYLERLRKELEG